MIKKKNIKKSFSKKIHKRSKKSSLMLFFYLKAVAIAAIVVFIGVYHYLSISAQGNIILPPSQEASDTYVIPAPEVESSVQKNRDRQFSKKLSKRELEKRNAVGYTLLMQAVSDANIDRIKELIEQGANVNAQVKDPFGMSVLEMAVFNGNELKVVEMVDILLAAGANPLLPDKQGRIPLHQVSNVMSPEGKKEIALRLMQYNSPINFQAHDGDTPMHSIVELPQYDLAVYMFKNFGPMVDMGIWNPNIKDLSDNMKGGIKGSVGQTVWELAQNNDMGEYLYEYLDAGNQRFGRNDSTKRNILGQNGLMLAIMRDDYVFAKDQIVNQSADVNAQEANRYGNRPLHFACMRAHHAVPYVELLINNGANTQLSNASGQKPINVVNKLLKAKDRNKIKRLLKIKR